MTGPLLILHSEIQQTVSSNSLTCKHSTGPVAWYLATNNTSLTTRSYGTFINIISTDGKQAQIQRGTDNRAESMFDGLWTCRLNGTTGAGAFHVGIYDNTPTTGKIMLPLQVDFSEVYSVRLSCCNICTLFCNHLNMLQKNHKTFKQ